MAVSILLPPPPSFPASMFAPSRLSGAALPPLAGSDEVDSPTFTEDDEYKALMLAEFGPLVPLLSQDQLQAMIMPAGDNDGIQSREAPLLPEVMMIRNHKEMQPCRDTKEGSKKRKKPRSTEEDAPRSSKRAKELPSLAESTEVDCPTFTEEDEYQALVLAEFGPLFPLPSQDQLQATIMLSGHHEEQIQSQEAPLLPDDNEPQVDRPMFTEDEDEYQALMLAEFGPLVPLPSQDQLQAMMTFAGDGEDDDDEIPSQAPLRLEDNKLQSMMISDHNEMQPYRDNKKRGKKRKKPRLSTEEDTLDEPSPRSSKRAKEAMEELPSPRETNKTMAWCLLERDHSAPEPSGPERQTIIRCLCEEDRPVPSCALHQHKRFRSWMREQGDGEIPAVGSGDGVVVPTRRTETKKTVLTYIRWRNRVWMPTRFYLEQPCSLASPS